MVEENGASNSVSCSTITSKYKVAFLGDAGVGKTCLISRFINDSFDDDYKVVYSANFRLPSESISFQKK